MHNHPLTTSLFFISLLAGACGSSDNSNYCDEETPCGTESAGSFCDLETFACGEEPMSSTPECTSDADCESGASCDATGSCQRCEPGEVGDSQCLGSDPDAPFCGSDGCVECLDSSQCFDESASVCDLGAGSCRGCASNDECDTGICEIEAGTCADQADIVHIATNGDDGPGCGSESSPCLTLEQGLTRVDENRQYMLVDAGDYNEAVTVEGIRVNLVADGLVTLQRPFAVRAGATVAMSGFRITRLGQAIGSGISCLSVGETASIHFSDGEIIGMGSGASAAFSCKMLIERTTISGSESAGVFASSGEMTIVDSVISNNGGDGIFGRNGIVNVSNVKVVSNRGLGLNLSAEIGPVTANVTGSTIRENGDHGLLLGRGDAVITNNVIADNGGPVFIGSEIGIADLSFNTITENQAGDDVASGVVCEGAATASGNIVYDNQGGPAVSGNCAWSYSNIEGGQAGLSNIDLPPTLDAGYHLQPGSPCIDAADPKATIAVDIDGESRPNANAHDIGADEANF